MRRLVLSLSFLSCPFAGWSLAQEGAETAPEAPAAAAEDPAVEARHVAALGFRELGPALMSGRIGEIVVDPEARSTWYVAACSGGVWKTVNAGTTWKPIFDAQGSYSIGTLALDPRDRFTLWVGTGENNSQRSVGYGDGIYKSIDGGLSFVKTGLEDSEHIARILVHPMRSDTVFVAVQGPLWRAGGERGVYRTRDGGKTWECVLAIDEHTGVTDLIMDPRDPDRMFAAAYQRRRHVWTLVDGGPGSGVFKTEDGGETWRRIERGLPAGDKGRIGLAISPQQPDVLYAIVEARDDEGGFYRSADRGESWQRMSDTVSGSPQYYQEIYADPHRFDHVYSLDTYMMVTEDGGRTFRRLGEADKHVDNHAIAFDPHDPDHLWIGCDGGLYETWDRGRTYRYFPNLPLTQFYRVAVSNDEPFYYVYGGTQDNATQGGPSRTRNVHGIRNEDWFVTVFGDGFEPAVDPVEPDVVYSQWQYGGLVRFDRRTGERIDIKPQEAAGGEALRWNWDSPLLISPHAHTRLYYGSQILFRSDDRGDTWAPISGDLSRGIDRNTLPVMGRVQSVDAVAKNRSTSFYGSIVCVSESPLSEDLLYAGTDDGLVQVHEGGSWRRIESFPDVPDQSYVNDVEACLYDPDTVFAVFNDHKRGNFEPYVLKSTDRGRSWTSIAGDLPRRGSVYAIVQDHVKSDLLFVGTEFGVYATIDGGAHWVRLSKGLPTIAVRDLEIQRREDDLVLATFGRGFYVLDDYAPLRDLSAETLAAEGHLFAVKDALAYVQDTPLGVGGKAFQGASFYTAPNPPFGATFTYHVRDALKTARARREKEEAERAKRGEDTPYPSWDALKAEDREQAPTRWLVVRDDQGFVVRRLPASTGEGIHRATWNLRHENPPHDLRSDGYGPLAVPGTYAVELVQRVDGVETKLAGPVAFEVVPLGHGTLGPADRAATLAFQQRTAELQRAVSRTLDVLARTEERLAFLARVAGRVEGDGDALRTAVRDLERRLLDVREAFDGDPTKPRRSEPAPPGLRERLNQVVGGHWNATSGPTKTHERNVEIASAEFATALGALRAIVEGDLPALEARFATAGAPVEPVGGLPRWPSGR